MIKYPIAPVSTGLNFRNIGEVEFRIAEAYYTLAECKMRSGDADGAKDLVNQVRGRYFANPSVLDTEPVPGAPAGFWKYDLDWMLSEWASSNAAEWVGLAAYAALIGYFVWHTMQAKENE